MPSIGESIVKDIARTFGLPTTTANAVIEKVLGKSEARKALDAIEKEQHRTFIVEAVGAALDGTVQGSLDQITDLVVRLLVKWESEKSPPARYLALELQVHQHIHLGCVPRYALAWGANTDTLFGVYEGRHIGRWNVLSGELERECQALFDAPVPEVLAFNAHRNELAVGMRSGGVQLLEAEQLQVVARLPPLETAPEVLEWTPNGDRLLALAGLKVLVADVAAQGEWREVTTGRERTTLFPKISPHHACWAGETVAVGWSTGEICVYSVDGTRLSRRPMPGGGAVVHLDWSKEDDLLLAAASDGEVVRLPASLGPVQTVLRLDGRALRVQRAVLSGPELQVLTSLTDLGRFRAWHAGRSVWERKQRTEGGSVMASIPIVAPGSSRILVPTNDGVLVGDLVRR